MEPLITVIVPVYKVEDYLRRCVDSILRQTYRCIEVILIDDGSPDNCGAICDEYAAADERVTVLHQRNRGLSAARNAGLAAARGDFVAFVDSDDWVHSSLLTELVRLMDEHDADISACKLRRTVRENTPELNESPAEVLVFSSRDALHQLPGPLYGDLVVANAKLYRKTLFDGIRYPEGRVHEDAFVAHKVIWTTSTIVFTSARLYYYWQRADSITASRDALRLLDARDCYRDRAEFFHRIGMHVESDVTYQKLFWVYFKDRRELCAAGDRALARKLLLEMQALAIVMGTVSSNLPITIRMFRTFPRLIDSYLRFRAPRLHW